MGTLPRQGDDRTFNRVRGSHDAVVRDYVLTAPQMVLGLISVQMVLSYPIYLAFPGSDFCSSVEVAAGGPPYMLLAYIATLLSLVSLIVLYHLLPTRRYVWRFQHQPFVRQSPQHYTRVWWALCATILLLCTIQFRQAGYVLPLLQGLGLSAAEYTRYRLEIAAQMNMTLANMTMQFVVPMNLFISFACMRRGARLFRAGSVALLILAACFSLARSFLAYGLVIFFFSHLVYRRVTLGQLYRLAFPTALVSFVLLSAVTFSTKADWSAAAEELIDRTIHGQWLGLPMYFGYFEQQRADAATLLHPALQSAVGITTQAITPGRELMEYYNRRGVDAGTAGNIPTFFIGEAYAVAGWSGVCLSIVYVSLMLWLTAYVFSCMKRTYFSCCLCGWVAYKFASGLICGVSAFLASGLTLVLLCLLGWCLLRAKRPTGARPPRGPVRFTAIRTLASAVVE